MTARIARDYPLSSHCRRALASSQATPNSHAGGNDGTSELVGEA